MKGILDWISNSGAWGPILFVVVYLIATILFVPGTIMGLGAGLLFGVLWGSVLVSVSSTLAATCAFLIGRYLARNWALKKIERNAKLKALDAAVAKAGWKIVLLTRLSPILPFNLLNYAFSITRVSLGEFVLASWLGMMPATILYVYLGSLAGDLANLRQSGRPRSSFEWALYGIGLCATMAAIFLMAKRAKAALSKDSTFE